MYQNDPLLCESIDSDLMLQQLDPRLILCMQILTKPVRDRWHLFSQADLHESLGTLKSKSMKQLYFLSTIFWSGILPICLITQQVLTKQLAVSF